tara:strand:- start:474 stop:818 length:345 start_codon:yes stop_codon:yes gene_type:complete
MRVMLAQLVVLVLTTASKKQRLATYALQDPIVYRTVVNVLPVLTGKAASQAGGAPTVQQDNFKRVALVAPIVQVGTKTRTERQRAKIVLLEVWQLAKVVLPYRYVPCVPLPIIW